MAGIAKKEEILYILGQENEPCISRASWIATPRCCT